MKSIVVLLLFSLAGFAQITERYDSFMGRYEYTNANGMVVGYKSYNSTMGTWTYTEVNSANGYNSPPRDYGKTINTSAVDLGGAVATIKQGRYNANSEKIQNAIDKNLERARAAFSDNNIFSRVADDFYNQYVKNLDAQRLDYSNINTANQALNYLNSGMTKLIGNSQPNRATKFKNDNTILALMKFKGVHRVKLVGEYKFRNGKWVFVNGDTSETYIDYQNYFLRFKRSYAGWLDRELVYKGYDAKTYKYEYTSKYGVTTIDSGFKIVTMFDNPDSDGNPTNKYVFVIAD